MPQLPSAAAPCNRRLSDCSQSDGSESDFGREFGEFADELVACCGAVAPPLPSSDPGWTCSRKAGEVGTAACLLASAEFRQRGETRGLYSSLMAWLAAVDGGPLLMAGAAKLLGTQLSWQLSPERSPAFCLPWTAGHFSRKAAYVKIQSWHGPLLRALQGGDASAGGLAYTRANLSDLAPVVAGLLNLGPIETMMGLKLQPRLCGLWVSSPGCVTPLHFDTCHGLLCQVRGQKRVWLADPTATRSLYINPAGHANPQSSRLNLLRWMQGDEAQLKAFPKAANVDWHEVILCPGQALYIPPLWWHHVETLADASVSVLLPFDPEPGELQHPCGSLL
eukprot:CAMPEP_0117695792 /NCGR_PEP_ID=MMETSP0804-20121206/28332_1 /TAXON_ID=1074897 /ORGANISM="Tetraselmis astigmatica, Strain CCMP880" /LENGTH=334 /DNA_ID=CAMNT_0005509895 /DNA_START=234 /DNA_END=1239 /DNA_ORIENTATION=-